MDFFCLFTKQTNSPHKKCPSSPTEHLKWLLFWLVVIYTHLGCLPEPKIEVKTPINPTHTLSKDYDSIHAPISIEPFVHTLEHHIPQIRTQLTQDLRLPIPKVSIYVQPSHQEMIQLAQAHHGRLPPEWAQGLAYPRLHQIYIQKGPLKQVLSTLHHEYIHIALANLPSLPLWLNEGVAVVFSEGLSWERMWTLNENANLGRLLSFNQLIRRFPYSSNQAQLAYAQSAHFVNYLIDQYGLTQFQSFLRLCGQNQSLEKASVSAFDTPFYKVEAQWKVQFKQGWSWIFFLFQESTIWAIVICLFMIRGWSVIRNKKRAIQDMIKKDHLLYERERTAIFVDEESFSSSASSFSKQKD